MQNKRVNFRDIFQRSLMTKGCVMALAMFVLSNGVYAETLPPHSMENTPNWNLGNHTYPVTTTNPKAQQNFDRGLVLAYGFNHAEAAKSFRTASKIDPDCAMCFWGEALVLGPNINAPMSNESMPVAWSAIQKAMALR